LKNTANWDGKGLPLSRICHRVGIKKVIELSEWKRSKSSFKTGVMGRKGGKKCIIFKGLIRVIEKKRKSQQLSWVDTVVEVTRKGNGEKTHGEIAKKRFLLQPYF